MTKDEVRVTVRMPRAMHQRIGQLATQLRDGFAIDRLSYSQTIVHLLRTHPKVKGQSAARSAAPSGPTVS